MKVISSKDYHDYVIKNGLLIGEFEQMYRKSQDIPWRQDKDNFSVFSNVLIEITRTQKSYGTILDIGCGLGYFTNRLKEFGNVVGIDISETAVNKARKKFPGIQFETADMRVKGSNFIKKNRGRFGLVLVKELMWYILPEIDRVLINIDLLLKKGGFLIVSNSFPPLGMDYYGKDILPGPEAVKGLFTINKSYSPMYFATLKRHMYKDEGPTVTVMYKKGK